MTQMYGCVPASEMSGRTRNPMALETLARYAVVPPFGPRQDLFTRPLHGQMGANDLFTRPLHGQMGQTGGEVGMGVGVGLGVMVALIALRIAGSYVAGAAISPKKDKKSRRVWGAIGVPLGFFFGPLGLGAMGLVATR